MLNLITKYLKTMISSKFGQNKTSIKPQDKLKWTGFIERSVFLSYKVKARRLRDNIWRKKLNLNANSEQIQKVSCVWMAKLEQIFNIPTMFDHIC